MLDWFANNIDIFLVTLLGLLVGSFLNVVIYRLPIMMNNFEKSYAWEVLHPEALPKDNPHNQKRFNLLFPPSSCPKCGHKIRAWENIPVLSYLLQKGKCVSCKTKISPRYVAVEILTAILSLLLAIKFQNQWLLLVGALVFTWVLVALFFIDAETQLLPDDLTLSLLWLGLAINLSASFVPLFSAVLGAILGYSFLWLTFHIFKIITGKEGMGYGDFKLLAACCAWQGAEALPFILVFASISGIIFAVSQKIGFGKTMAFGPFLCAGAWLNLMINF